MENYFIDQFFQTERAINTYIIQNDLLHSESKMNKQNQKKMMNIE